MGTEITLSLNGIDIDYGKNRYWRSHSWLFPPSGLAEIDYFYADGVVGRKPGFETTLQETYFRLCHLGYSLQETRSKFDAAVARWNRTADLGLSFDNFHSALTDLDFSSLTPADLKPFMWDFRAFVVDLLSAWDTDDALLEDFVAGLDFGLTLRVLADRVENRSLWLRWHHQDLVDSGWASLEDLTELDRLTSIANHTMLMGRLQDCTNATSVRAFDQWLTRQGLSRSTTYSKLLTGRTVREEVTTLPTAVRNMIHHPENPHNDLSDDKLRDSIELLLEVCRRLPEPLPGLMQAATPQNEV